MYVVINGGGKVGSYLARTLMRKGHDVAVIEKRADVVRKLAEELPTTALLIEGDGCDVRFQEDAGVGRADVFAAVTGDDDDNLVSCQLARVNFKAKRAVARVNSPRNEHIFNALGIEAISSTTVISRLIEEELTAGDVMRLLTIKKGKLALLELEIPPGFHALEGKRLAELELPEDTVLVTIVRGEEVIVPKGSTRLKTGDRVLALSAPGHEDDLRRVLQGR